MQAAPSSAAFSKGFDNEKGDCIISNAELPCALVSSSAFQMEREKVCIILLLDRKLVCSMVASWLPQDRLWDHFWVSAKSCLPPSTLILTEWDSMPSSSDQWFPNGEAVMHSMSFKKNTEILCIFLKPFSLWQDESIAQIKFLWSI